MNAERSLVNEKAGAVLKDAVEKYPKTQIEIAETVGISTKQLQNYSKGIFPRYKGENIKALDDLLGTNLYPMIYADEDKSENEVRMKSKKQTAHDMSQGQSLLEGAVADLSKAKVIDAEANLISAKNIEKLIGLLEQKLIAAGGGIVPRLPQPGQPGTRPIAPGKKARNGEAAN